MFLDGYVDLQEKTTGVISGKETEALSATCCSSSLLAGTIKRLMLILEVVTVGVYGSG